NNLECYSLTRIFVDTSEAKSFVGTPEHQKMAVQMARDSITLVKNEEVLPFNGKSEDTIFIAGVTYVAAIANYTAQHNNGKVIAWQADSHNPYDKETGQAVHGAEKADRIIMATYSLAELPSRQSQLVKGLLKTGKPMVVVSLGLPYDYKNFPEVEAYLASYALDNWQLKNLTSIQAALDVVFGETPGGKLPVTI